MFTVRTSNITTKWQLKNVNKKMISIYEKISEFLGFFPNLYPLSPQRFGKVLLLIMPEYI